MKKFILLLILLFSIQVKAQTITPPTNQDIPVNSSNYSVTASAPYILDGYDSSTDYSVAVLLESTSEALISINTTTGLNNPGLAFPTDFSDVDEIYFSGTPSEITAALNSITVNTTNDANAEIKIQVYIYEYDADTFFNPLNGHAYKIVVNQSISWSDARDAAAATSFGQSTGYLITVTSQQEHDFAYRLDKGYWLGLSDEESEGTFKWVTGPETGEIIRTPDGNVDGVFEKWATNKPSNYGGYSHYVGFYRPLDQYYGWRDYGTTSNEIYGYAIEYGTSSDGMTTDLQNVQTSEVVLTQKRYLSDATIADIPAYTATGSAVEPSLIVDYFGTSLVLGTDYTATYSNNTTPGTATVTLTGIGDCVGTLSATYQVVELTPPSAENVPANATGHSINGTYSLSGYDASKDYSVVISLEGTSGGATFSVVTTTGLSFPGMAFPTDLTDVTEAYFYGSPSDIENALNSITYSTTNVAFGEIKMHVYIYSYVANTVFNPGNGHVYNVVSDQSISWSNALSASSSTSFGATGYMVTVTSQDEQDFFYRLDKSVWLGLSDEESEGTFKWVTGPESGTVVRTPSGNVDGVFEKWASGQPNNSGGNEHYVGFYRPAGSYYGWRDYSQTANEIYGYVTEYGTSTSGLGTDVQSVQTSLVVLTQNKYLADATIAEIPAYTATGSAVEPSLIVDYFGTTLVKDTDYTVVFTDNVSAGTASVSVSGIGDYLGTISSTFEVVELTSPTNQNVPVNTQNWDLSGQFNLSGYDSTKTYKAAVIVEGDTDSSFSVTQTSGITFDFGYDDWTEVQGVNFKGTAENLQSALNSIQINTSANNDEIKLRVFITTQIENTFLNPANGHIYEFVPGQITWTDANSISSSLNYESEPGYITTLTSEVEDNFVSIHVQAQDFWIGLSDAANEGEWYWVTGPEAGTLVWSASNSNETGFTGIINGQWCNWVTNDPNNANYNTGTGQDYAVAKFEGNVEWNDVNNGDTRVDGYVIEYGDWSDAMDLTFYSTQKTEIILTKISQGVTIESSDTTTSEGGDEASFTVVLNINPIDDVTIPINSSDVSEGTITVDELVFTPSNWEVPQTVIVTGIGDELLDGDISYLIETGNPVSNDSNYDALLASDISDLTFTNQDNDIDSDGDGISDAQEGYNSTDPDISTDTDGDGVADYLEDNNADEDGDGTPDHQDLDNDTDGDGISNGEETTAGTNPLNSSDTPTDTDGDGIPDINEGSGNVPATDSDNDGVADYLEDNTAGDHTNPDNDSDGDGYGNSDEIAEGTDPLDGSDLPTETTNWSGAGNGDWSAEGNWSNGVPSSNYNVVIPADLSNYPTASSAVVVNSMTLASGASFIAQSTFTGAITYNRTLSSNNWYLVSSPVVGETLEGLISNHTFATGSGSNIGIAPYANNGSAWDYQTTAATGALASGSGYSVMLAAAGTISFNGTFPTTDVSIGVTEDVNGLNLVGNPYPSYIAANSNADAVNNILSINSSILSEETLWFWDSGSSSYVTFNQASNAKFVSPAQGFFVSSNGSNTFSFTEAMQSHQSDSFQKSTATRSEISLRLTNGTDTRDTDIFYIEGTTTGWDNGYDSSIFGGTTNSFAIYTHLVSESEGQNLGIQSLPDNGFESMIIPVGINAISGTEITISVATQNLPDGMNVYLEDKEDGSFTLLNSDVNYTTTLSATLNGIGRYYLHTSSKVLETNDLAHANISIYTINENSIRVVGVQSGAAKVRVYSILGKQVHTTSFQGNGINNVNLPNVAKGVYLMQLETAKGVLNKKIFIE